MAYRNRFLARLSSHERAHFRPHLVEVSLKPGQTLMRQWESIEQIYFPHTCVVALAAAQQADQAVLVGLTGPEGVIGGAAALGISESISDATVRIAGAASRISVEKFCAGMRQTGDRLREDLARRELLCQFQAQQAAAANALRSAEARVCRLVLELADRVEQPRIAITQTALAAMLGLQRTTVTLMLSRLQKAGALWCGRGHFRILDRGEIEHRSCGCYARMIEGFTHILGGQTAGRGADLENAFERELRLESFAAPSS
ncbi:MAG: Crp/Fnr family transcriptional regulator [Variibacter sp.]|nr:Crp/Fnr family transcriptional regulator [Variibacter sp.]